MPNCSNNSEKVVFDGEKGVITYFRGRFLVYRKDFGFWHPIGESEDKKDAFNMLRLI